MRKAIALGAFSLLWVADTFLTTIGVINAGPSAEGNPLVRWLIVNYGLDAFISVKLVILGAWWMIYPLTKLWHNVFITIVMIPIVAAWIAILYW